MIEATLLEGIVFKKLFESFNDLLEVVTFDCSETGIKILSVNKSINEWLNLELSRDVFEYFACDRAFTKTVDLSPLNKLLKCMSTDDALTFRASNCSPGVTFTFDSKNVIEEKEFYLNTTERINEGYFCIPEECNLSFNVSSKTFTRRIGECADIGDLIKISCAREEVRFYSKGAIGVCEVTFNKPVLKRITQQHATVHTFDSSALNNLRKAAELSDSVKLSFHGPMLVLEVLIQTAHSHLGKIIYVMASKV